MIEIKDNQGKSSLTFQIIGSSESITSIIEDGIHALLERKTPVDDTYPIFEDLSQDQRMEILDKYIKGIIIDLASSYSIRKKEIESFEKIKIEIQNKYLIE